MLWRACDIVISIMYSVRQKKSPVICQFEAPVSDRTHSKPEVSNTRRCFVCVSDSVNSAGHSSMCCPMWGRSTPLPSCLFTSSFPPFYFSLSYIGFTYFLLLSIASLSTRIVPLRFQAGGHRRRPNLGLVCVLLCNLCCLYFLVKMDCGVLFYLV